VASGLPASARIVDTHAHVWPRGVRHPGQQKAPTLAGTPADLLAVMDATGVDAGIVSPAMLAYPDNAYVLGAAGTAPDRIFAVVGIDPRDPAAVRSIPSMAAYGALGVRFNLGATPLTTAQDLEGLDALVDAARDADLVIQWTIPLSATHLVERAAGRCPDARQVLDHLGLPADAHDLAGLAQVRALAAIPCLNIKLSGLYAISRDGYPYRDVWPWAEGVVTAFGSERTMWASDWPLAGESAPYGDHLALVGLLPFLDADARSAILGGTAIRVWIGGGTPAG
jgi:predicted TIM-barrel fold metal-dependent hydrolase